MTAVGMSKFCGRPKHQGDGDCRRPAGWGTSHPGWGPCKLHGGALPVVVAASHRRMIEAEAAGHLERYGFAPVTDPVGALASLAGEMEALKNYLAARVADLRDDDWSSTTDIGVEQANAIVQAYERSLERLGRSLADMAKLNIEERLVRIEAARIDLMGVVLVGVLEELGLDMRATPVMEALRRWLPMLDGEPAPPKVKRAAVVAIAPIEHAPDEPDEDVVDGVVVDDGGDGYVDPF